MDTDCFAVYVVVEGLTSAGGAWIANCSDAEEAGVIAGRILAHHFATHVHIRAENAVAQQSTKALGPIIMDALSYRMFKEVVDDQGS